MDADQNIRGAQDFPAKNLPNTETERSAALICQSKWKELRIKIKKEIVNHLDDDSNFYFNIQVLEKGSREGASGAG